MEPQRPRNTLKFVHALWIFSQKSKVFAGRQSVAKSKSIGRCGNFFLSRFFPLDLRDDLWGGCGYELHHQLVIQRLPLASQARPFSTCSSAVRLGVGVVGIEWRGCSSRVPRSAPRCASRPSVPRIPAFPLSPSCTECVFTLVFAGRPATCFISARLSPSSPSPSNERFPSTPCVHCLLLFVASRTDGLARVVASSLAWPQRFAHDILALGQLESDV